MLHQWFMDFGGIAMLLALVSFVSLRFVLKRNPAKNSDDRQGRAFGFFAVAALAAIFLVIGFFMACFGIGGTIPGWIGVTLGGFAFAMLSTDN